MADQQQARGFAQVPQPCAETQKPRGAAKQVANEVNMANYAGAIIGPMRTLSYPAKR
jgi:hypothetical protein